MDVQAILAENTADELKQAFLCADSKMIGNAREIRIRQGLPLAVRTLDGEFFVSPSGEALTRTQGAFVPTQNHLKAMVERLTGHSPYAFDSEIKNGYITITGGHRVGICGRVTLEDGRIKTIKHISGLNLRVAREVTGAAAQIFPYIYTQKCGPHNTIFVSPPGCGKTTILRDAVRRLSYQGLNVAVVDERSEIAGCHMGVAQNDLGPRTDVLDAAPKASGMMLALRALSPQVIAVDEIGGAQDVEAIGAVCQSGVAVLCSLHGKNIGDVQARAALAPLLSSKAFTRFVFLTDVPRPGTIEAVYDEENVRLGGPPCY